jgi:uncharacterized membrane protein
MTPSVVAYAPKDGSAPCEAKPCFARCERVSKISRDGKFWIVMSDKTRSIMNECHPRFSRTRGKS